MLIIHHTLTAKDIDLIIEHLAHAGITARSRISRPFRVILAALSVFIFYHSLLLIPTKPLEGLFAIVMACACLYLAIWPFLMRRTITKLQQALQSRVGSDIRYEIDETGIKFAGRHLPWTSFRSFMAMEAGIMLSGESPIYFPAAALCGQNLKAELLAHLKRHVKEKS